MGEDVKTKGTTVAVNVGGSGADEDLVEVVVNVEGATVEPVLGSGVAVAEDDGRKTGDGVVAVGHTPLGASLGSHEVGEGIVTDTWGAVVVQVNGVTSGTEVGSGEGRDGTTEGVTSRDDLVAWVGLESSSESSLDGGLNLIPGVLEASVDVAVVHEVAGSLQEVDVGDPVADVAASTNRDDNLLAGVVGCYVTANAGRGATD